METSTTQVERLANKLRELKPDVTTKDRNKAALTLRVNKETISRYLNGKSEIMDSDTAVKMIQFFTACIEKREAVIND